MKVISFYDCFKNTCKKVVNYDGTLSQIVAITNLTGFFFKKLADINPSILNS